VTCVICRDPNKIFVTVPVAVPRNLYIQVQVPLQLSHKDTRREFEKYPDLKKKKLQTGYDFFPY
jgi:hypothetical protein